MPNERPALAMLIVGFSVAGVVVWGIVFGQIWWLMKQRYTPIKYHVHF
jgi:hypothetical protein